MSIIKTFQPGNSKFKEAEIIRILIPVIIVIVVVLLISHIFGGIGNFFDSIGQALHITSSKEAKDADTANQSKINDINSNIDDNYFSPVYHRAHPATLRTDDFIQGLAKQIYDSVGYIYDTPSEAVAAFKQLQYKTQVSQLADAFNTLYQLDLLSYLKTAMDTDSQKIALKEILDYTESLPTGYM